MYDIIEKKRDGSDLSKAEIDFFIENYTAGEIPDYQVSALLMAIYFRGMTIEESAHLTMAMVHSGNIVDLSNIEGIKVDKHSTGGVGDTATLILAPLVASLGIPVPKMSGRGLGHTGGTIDKLESIAGFHTELTEEEFTRLVNNNGLAVIGQSENIAPADKLLYSLRDVTATVNSIPLIASSIMSKKIAASADVIVLDVKTGSGAFMKDLSDARILAKTMVEIGRNVGKKTVAIITNMEQPLGYAIGNALEIEEAILTLQGKGPKDLTELVIELGAQMTVLAQKANSLIEAKEKLVAQIRNGKALETFKLFIQSQGGDVSVIDNPSLLPQAKYKKQIKSTESGYVTQLIAEELGKAAMLLGAGRQTKETVIDLAVGIVFHKKVGDYVHIGDTLCTIHSNFSHTKQIEEKINNSIGIGAMRKTIPLIIETID